MNAVARSRNASRGVAIIRQTGISAAARPARYSPSVSATPASAAFVRAHRPSQWIAPHPADEVRLADDQPGLRAADQLVAAEGHDIGPGGEAL